MSVLNEAARLLGLLGLPHDTTMESRSFTIIEERISPYKQKLTGEILHDNLSAAVQSTTADPKNFNEWKESQCCESQQGGTLVLGRDKYPKIKVSFDMAWQQATKELW